MDHWMWPVSLVGILSTAVCQNLLIGFKPKRLEPEKASTMVENYRRRGIDR
jgi:hypothetical protein